MKPGASFYLTLSGPLLAAFSGLVLAARPAPGRKRHALLVLLLLLMGLYGIGFHLTEVAGFERFPHLMRVGSTLGMAFMPLLYLYARSLASPERPLGPADAWHGLPLALQTLLRLPFFLMSAEAKLRYGAPSWDHAVNRGGLVLLTLGYGVALLRLHRKHEGRLPEEHSRLEGRHLTWILLLFAAWSVVPLLELWEGPWGLPSAPFGQGPLGGLLMAFTAFLALSRSPASHPPSPGASLEQAPEPRPGTPRPEREAELLQRVLAYVDLHAPYLEPELSLAELAGRLRLPPAYVSRALNRQLGENFFTFINRRRVETAQRLLLDEPDRSILDIGLAAGFSSKSTFNSAFKKATGLTPSEFRKARPDSCTPTS